MKPSTRSFFRLHGWRNLLDFLHGYFYGRWPTAYLNIITGRSLKKRMSSTAAATEPRPVRPPGAVEMWFAERYHSKVLTSDSAGRIVRLDRPLRVDNPERVIPFDIANRIILDTPGSLAVMRCPCRQTKGTEPCGPVEVCMVVGEPFVDFVIEHGTNGARRVSRGEAVGILEDTKARGWVHTAWFKDAMGGRFYAICNCCSCCCIPMGFMRKTGNASRFVTSSGYVAVLDDETCDGCGACDAICPFRAMGDDNGTVVIDRDQCFGCGVCASLCPGGAVTLVADPEKGVPFDIENL